MAATLLPALLRERQAKGLETYGRPLETFNGRSAHRDILDELVDALQYTVQANLEHEVAVSALVAIRELLQDTSDCMDWLDLVAKVDHLVDVGLGEAS